MRNFFLLIIAGCILSSCTTNTNKETWIPLFNGKELPPYHHYLGKPDKSLDIPGLERDSLGNYLEGLGWTDPTGVYTVDSLDGEAVIRISGEVIGGLVLADSLANYHLKLKFKWGKEKWSWMEGRPKDGGILYHGGLGSRHEYQIHEGDVGSYWAKRVIMDIPAQFTTDLPEAIKIARPYLQPIVPELRDTMLIFDPEAPLHHFEGKNEWQIVIANPYNEKPHGEWNELELICFENHAAHIINDKVNLILLNSFIIHKGVKKPINQGRLALQSEGAVIYFKDIYYKKIDEMPDVFKPFFE